MLDVLIVELEYHSKLVFVNTDKLVETFCMDCFGTVLFGFIYEILYHNKLSS